MKKIFILTGELSGETHAKNLIRYMKQIRKDLKFYAIGSGLLKKEGCLILEDYKNISIIGFIEVLSKYFLIKKILKKVFHFLQSQRPDMVILVDFPGFNLRVARYCHDLGIKTVYFIPPQIWAWHYHRVEEIKKYIDLVIPVLDFEKKIYGKERIPYTFFGHPVTENIWIRDKDLKIRLNIPKKHKLIAVFPGSRAQEIKYNLDVICRGVCLIQSKMPDTFILMGCASNIKKNILQEKIKTYHLQNTMVLQDRTCDILNIADCAIMVSGTITLEGAFFLVPMLVVYNLSKLSYLLIRYFLIRTKFISLVNLLFGKKIVEELVGKDLTPENISLECLKILQNRSYRQDQQKALKKVKSLLGRKGDLEKTARKILQIV
ncbi:MAG: lipid-A-disaccharide synthase [Spirochaetes bacterium]|nr:lipid-A-disaccharide synthase [Spirochaetota bacterium]